MAKNWGVPSSFIIYVVRLMALSRTLTRDRISRVGGSAMDHFRAADAESGNG